MKDERLKGQCPMGCGETLFVGSGGFITCAFLECPNPSAVSDLLEHRETEHVVKITDEGFTIQHPLRERLEGELFDCPLHGYMTARAGRPGKPGRYRAQPTADKSHWIFDEMGG